MQKATTQSAGAIHTILYIMIFGVGGLLLVALIAAFTFKLSGSNYILTFALSALPAAVALVVISVVRIIRRDPFSTLPPLDEQQWLCILDAVCAVDSGRPGHCQCDLMPNPPFPSGFPCA